MRKFLFRCLLLSLLFQLQAVKAIYAQCTFTNPIQQAESPDPYVLYNNGFYYYMVTTGDGVWIHKSANLQDVGHASRTKVWGSGGEIRRDVWAPELHYLNGRWYIYACGNLSDDGFNMRMFVLEGNSQDPMGSYTYRGLLAPEASGIDGSAWQDPANGKIYYTWSQFDPQGQTIWIAPMDSPTVVGHPRVRISEPTNGWERIDGLVNEGPIFLKKNNKLHIIYSASQCASAAYCLGRLTCSDGNYLNAGSWGKVGPVFQRSDANGVYGAGHNGFTKSPNGQEDWIVYHAKSGTAFTNSDRSVRIQRFGWNSDDTPNFGIPERTGVQLACPSAGIVPQTPYTGVINLPGVVEAENFDNGSEGVSYHDMTPSNLIGPFRSGTDVDTEPCTEGGNNLAFSDNGEWLEYTVNVANTRAYTLDARVASPFNTGAFHIEMDGANITGTLAVPNTGGWQTWATVSKIVNLTAGQHIMRFVIDAKEFNTNKFTFTAQGNPPVQTQTPYAEVIGLPGVVEAENFDNGGESIAYHDTEEANLGGVQRTTGPDVFTCVSAEGSNAVGWINNGEWLEYTVNAATAGSYTINARVASVFATGIFHLEWDGKNVSGAIAVPNTGDWQAWQSVTKKVTLTAGQHILRVFADAGNFNLNKITFSQGTTPPPMSGVYRLVNRQSKLVLDV
ncbi:MAG: family 43 glycosylhydrolase, partial [Bacteroidota bacterium]